MELRIDPRTLERAEERGTSVAEISDVIDTGFTIAARPGRMGKGKVYSFGQSRHGRHYPQKRVEVIYTVEGDEVTTVTVYVFYGHWEGTDADSVQ